jgi:hypothetical protein
MLQRFQVATVFVLWVLGACTPSRDVWDPCNPGTAANPQDAMIMPTGECLEAGTRVGWLADGACFSNANPVDYSTCPDPVRCVTFSAIGQDGLCHPTGPVCATPCRSNAECAGQGKNVICSSTCNTAPYNGSNDLTGICTPMQ